jgi:hypothetical protein
MRIIKSRRKRWARHVARMGEMSTYFIGEKARGKETAKNRTWVGG